jgi:DNA-binding IscR family transcriptional regulator
MVTDSDHRALYGVFLEVRDAAAKILERTTVADIVGGASKSRKRPSAKKKTKNGSLLSIVHKAAKGK